jgi:superoxide dismutase
MNLAHVYCCVVLLTMQTMRIHHDLHHAGYVRNLNAALKKAADSGSNLYGKTLSKVCGHA